MLCRNSKTFTQVLTVIIPPADFSIIAEQLRVSLAWCAKRELPPDRDYSNTFRSSTLAAHAARAFPDSCHTKYSAKMADAFAEFTRHRTSQVTTAIQDNAAAELTRPRSLLAFNWRSSLFDGAATPQTLGFLNDDYMPPWDTWLHIVCISELDYDPYCLISWVPQSLAGEINSGIVVDPAESLSWCTVSPTGTIILHGWGKPIGKAFN